MTPLRYVPASPAAPPRAATIGLAGAVLAAMILAGFGAGAADPYARSQSPHWKVGRLDPALSHACRRLQFNQRNAFDTFIGFYGARGRGSTGVAQKNWNLDDPLGLARAGFTYHFFNDGLSDCTVYVAGRAEGPP